ncbi:unnamed protein product [Parnassius apollo]|uniref:(apollo) hypothetical protein n=1 Tax=Parnassius apollo TaxID=110799 RepID=A0A8S3XNF8_PARAO|nr:unnamed protein product [Parnassius apollo]
MPKPQYSHKFRDSWLQDPDLKEWLQVFESTTSQVAKCKFCGTVLRSHYGDLKTHALSKKHQQNRKVITKQPKLTFKKESTDNKKKDEARVALFTAMHTSIRTVDHLGEVINYSHEKEIKCRCTELSAHNASVMGGVNNGVFARLKQEIPHLVLLMGKCCNNYEIPLNLIKQIGTKVSYQSDKDNSKTENENADSSEDDLLM